MTSTGLWMNVEVRPWPSANDRDLRAFKVTRDEFYAASAYLSREPTALGSIVGQDIAKGILIFLFVLGSLIATLSGALGHNWIAGFTKFFLG